MRLEMAFLPAGWMLWHEKWRLEQEPEKSAVLILPERAVDQYEMGFSNKMIIIPRKPLA